MIEGRNNAQTELQTTLAKQEAANGVLEGTVEHLERQCSNSQAAVFVAQESMKSTLRNYIETSLDRGKQNIEEY